MKKIKGEIRIDSDGDVELFLRGEYQRWFCRRPFGRFCPALVKRMQIGSKPRKIILTQLKKGIKLELA